MRITSSLVSPYGTWRSNALANMLAWVCSIMLCIVWLRFTMVYNLTTRNFNSLCPKSAGILPIALRNTNEQKAPKRPQQIDLQEEDLNWRVLWKNHLKLKSLKIYTLSKHNIARGVAVAADSQLWRADFNEIATLDSCMRITAVISKNMWMGLHLPGYMLWYLEP